jgi:hypothetical protein
VLFAIGQRLQGTTFASRYVLPLLPAYLGMLTVGVVALADLATRRFKLREGRAELAAVALGALAAAPNLGPAWQVTRLTGRPTPYKEIVAWTDANLPRGTPVLVDRWYEPWNELKVHASTNVFFTFTVPDEPLDNFQNLHWRDTVQAFCAKHPEAAYLEVARNYWDHPQVGPWDWPGKYFARKMEFRNEAGLELRRLGLAARDDFYTAHTNRLIVDLYYNTRDDALARARAGGERTVVFHGEGWTYTKTQDYRDWRIVEGAARLDVYNLGDAAVQATLKVAGVAVSNPQRLQIGSLETPSFPAGQLSTYELGPVTLQPGLNSLPVRVPAWMPNGPPLLVEGVQATVTGS